MFLHCNINVSAVQQGAATGRLYCARETAQDEIQELL